MSSTPPVIPFVKLVTHDIEALAPFYIEAFDFKIEYRVTSDDEPEWALDEILMHNAVDEGTTLVLLSFHNRPVVDAGGVILGMRVTDLPATLDKVVAAGGTITRPLKEMPEHGVKVAFVEDPHGTMIEIIEMLPKA